jgi:hypothetical protein
MELVEIVYYGVPYDDAEAVRICKEECERLSGGKKEVFYTIQSVSYNEEDNEFYLEHVQYIRVNDYRSFECISS